MTHGSWKNPKTANGYIENSVAYKKRTENMITSLVNDFSTTAVLPTSSTSTAVVPTPSSSKSVVPTPFNTPSLSTVVPTSINQTVPANPSHTFSFTPDESLEDFISDFETTNLRVPSSFENNVNSLSPSIGISSSQNLDNFIIVEEVHGEPRFSVSHPKSENHFHLNNCSNFTINFK